MGDNNHTALRCSKWVRNMDIKKLRSILVLAVIGAVLTACGTVGLQGHIDNGRYSAPNGKVVFNPPNIGGPEHTVTESYDADNDQGFLEERNRFGLQGVYYASLAGLGIAPPSDTNEHRAALNKGWTNFAMLKLFTSVSLKAQVVHQEFIVDQGKEMLLALVRLPELSGAFYVKSKRHFDAYPAVLVMVDGGYVVVLRVQSNITDMQTSDPKENVSHYLGELRKLKSVLKVRTSIVLADNINELYEAAKVGNAKEVKILLDKGTDPNSTVDEGNTALMTASYRGHEETVKLLLERGAKPNLKNINGCTAATSAVIANRANILKILLEKGADPNVKNVDGVPLIVAPAGKGWTEILHLMLSKGADPNIKDFDGITALMVAAGQGQKKTADILLAKGADADAQSWGGRFGVTSGSTPLMGAAQGGYVDIAKALLAGGANPNKKDVLGHTSLMVAVVHNKPRIVELLLRHGADVNAPDINGHTALSVAKRENYSEIVLLLENSGAKH
jgi:ankyrin repeat protein